jgi:hypothetical protein
MQPAANTDEVENDFRYGMLVKELTTSKIPIEEAYNLHRWLSDEAGRQLQQKAMTNSLGTQTFSQKIKTCTKLEKCASTVTEQFDFLHQFSALEFTMSQVFSSLQQGQSEHWRTFRERFAADMALLAQVAKQTVTEISRHEKKQIGRRPKEWRNSLVLELMNYFVKLSGQSQEECIALTHNICSLYFPDDSVDEPESIRKIVTRKRKNMQGQN